MYGFIISAWKCVLWDHVLPDAHVLLFLVSKTTALLFYISGSRNPKPAWELLGYSIQVLKTIKCWLILTDCFQGLHSALKWNEVKQKDKALQTNYNITVCKKHKTKQDLDKISFTPNFLQHQKLPRSHSRVTIIAGCETKCSRMDLPNFFYSFSPTPKHKGWHLAPWSLLPLKNYNNNKSLPDFGHHLGSLPANIAQSGYKQLHHQCSWY